MFYSTSMLGPASPQAKLPGLEFLLPVQTPEHLTPKPCHGVVSALLSTNLWRASMCRFPFGEFPFHVEVEDACARLLLDAACSKERPPSLIPQVASINASLCGSLGDRDFGTWVAEFCSTSGVSSIELASLARSCLATCGCVGSSRRTAVISVAPPSFRAHCLLPFHVTLVQHTFQSYEYR